MPKHNLKKRSVATTTSLRLLMNRVQKYNVVVFHFLHVYVFMELNV